MKTLYAVLLVAALAIVAALAGFFLARQLRSEPGAGRAPIAASSLIGKPAPALIVRTLDGGSLDLASYRGKTVLLNFWASWCGPCVEEMPLLDQFDKQRRDQGLVVIGVAVEDADAVREFLDEHPVDYQIALGSAGSPDESAAFGNRLNVLPYSVLIDPDGVIRRANAGSFDADELVAWLDWRGN